MVGNFLSDADATIAAIEMPSEAAMRATAVLPIALPLEQLLLVHFLSSSLGSACLDGTFVGPVSSSAVGLPWVGISDRLGRSRCPAHSRPFPTNVLVVQVPSREECSAAATSLSPPR